MRWCAVRSGVRGERKGLTGMRREEKRRPGSAWAAIRLALCVVVLVAMGFSATGVRAQVQPAQREMGYYAHRNSFGVLASYSDDSSHMLLGISQNRRLLGFGASYGRRLWHGRAASWQYNAEIVPVSLVSNPWQHYVMTFTSPTAKTLTFDDETVLACRPGSGSFTGTVDGKLYSYSYVNTCSRRWTVGTAFSPIGFQWNFLPRHKIQPVLTGHGGFMYSSQPIPVAQAGSFNFTFDFGAGVEVYRTKTRSVRAEYRYHHLSNAYTAVQNPGIDSGLFQVTYVFGR